MQPPTSNTANAVNNGKTAMPVVQVDDALTGGAGNNVEATVVVDITQGETWDDAGEMIRDAMSAWIAVHLEDGRQVPVPRTDDSPSRVLLRLPHSLHRELQRAAEREGVSLNQYLLYQLAAAVGRSDDRAAGADNRPLSR